MSTVKVWNDSESDYRENFKGRDIYIRSKDFITLSRAEAVQFQGTYTPARKDGVGRLLNEKRIRLEFDHEKEAERKDQPIKWTCDITKKQFRTDIAWEKHLEELAKAKPTQNEETDDNKNTRSKPAGRRQQPIL